MKLHPLLMFALAAACVVGLTACTPSSPANEVYYNAAYPVYATAADLSADADVVVQVEVIASAVKELGILEELTGEEAADPELNPGGSTAESETLLVYTVHHVRVTKVVKGDVAVGSVIEVKELGGTLGDTKFLTPEGTLLGKGGEYLLFLKTFKGSPASLLNPIQATYAYEDERLVSMVGNTIQAKDIEITLELDIEESDSQ